MKNLKLFTFAVTCLAVSAIAPSAYAGSLTADFFTLSPSNPDVEHDIPGVQTGLVQSKLGPDGLPVASALALTGFASGSSNHISDVNGSNEILWWTPSANVTAAAQNVIVSLPYNQVLFPNGTGIPNGSGFDGSDGYTSAHLSGTFNLASVGTITMSLGSDDDAWVFVNGNLVDDNGGVHGFSDVPFDVTTDLNVGLNTLDIFFADRHTVGSELAFNADINISPTTGVPEPLTLSVFGAGLAGAAAMRRRKKAKA